MSTAETASVDSKNQDGRKLAAKFHDHPGASASFVLMLLIGVLAACTPPSNPVPTLIPTPLPPTVTRPIASDVPTVTARPPATHFVPTSAVVIANHTATLILTADQLNAELARRFADQPLPDFIDPPYVTLAAGALQMAMRIKTHDGQPVVITLTLTLTALPTTQGTVLDVRAVNLSALNGLTTQQVKLGHALLNVTLNDLAAHAAGTKIAAFTYVAVNAQVVTLTASAP